MRTFLQPLSLRQVLVLTSVSVRDDGAVGGEGES
jgi:hypothetical protein